ncbi:MAG: argininosuccinate lyase [Desulfurivibrionaceae bacterium]
MTDSKKLWGGRFSESTAASVEKFTESVQYDWRLFRHDIAGSRAHARMLCRQNIISGEELDSIIQGLDAIEKDIEEGGFEFKTELEDIHMNIEKALIDRIGPAGAKLHTARSRNDQICLDTRLYLRDESNRLKTLLGKVNGALVRLARSYLGTIMPGYTHLQRAQPVLLSHHLLAYYEMFKRDMARLEDGLKRINVLPLGAAALAGTGLPIDREYVAAELGFPEISRNSMDTVADRDFAVEFLSTCTIIQLHLSRLAEELVIWSSDEFGFVEISDSFCTGSSIMPQKKNPDIPELIRGKSGRVAGHLMSLITTMKGLPLTYNRDLQEDKEPLFDTADTLSRELAITAEMLSHLKFNEKRLEEAAGGGFMTATDLADYLVKKNIPFRKAHSIVGQVVSYCLDQGKELTELTLEELQGHSPVIDRDIFYVLSEKGSVNSRISPGGTAEKEVKKVLREAEKELESIL